MEEACRFFHYEKYNRSETRIQAQKKGNIGAGKRRESGAERAAENPRICLLFGECARRMRRTAARKSIANLVVSGRPRHFTGGGAFAIMTVKQGGSGRPARGTERFPGPGGSVGSLGFAAFGGKGSFAK